MEIQVNGITVSLLVGADPEMFLKKNGNLISAHGLIPGDKDNPHPVAKGAIQVDGTAAEFNIDPSATAEEFQDNISTVLGELKKHLDSDVSIEAIPTAEFGKAFIASLPPEVKELGCSADYNAFTSKENAKPDGELPFRTGSGHVHIGWTQHANEDDPNHLEICEDVIKLCDLYMGVPSLFLDDDTKRRELYGSAGAYRPKSYGAEYRVLSNFWLKSQGLQRWVFDTTGAVIKKYLEGERVTGDLADRVVRAINLNDLGEAKALLKEFNITLPKGVIGNASI